MANHDHKQVWKEEHGGELSGWQFEVSPLGTVAVGYFGEGGTENWEFNAVEFGQLKEWYQEVGRLDWRYPDQQGFEKLLPVIEKYDKQIEQQMAAADDNVTDDDHFLVTWESPLGVHEFNMSVGKMAKLTDIIKAACEAAPCETKDIITIDQRIWTRKDE